jgi:hypothetical protein
MQQTLTDFPVIRCTQSTTRIDSKQLEAIDQLLLILPERIPAALWRKIPEGSKLQALLKKRPADDVPALLTRLGNTRQTMVVAGRIAPGAAAFDQLTMARKLVTTATTEKAGCLGIAVLGFAQDEQHALSKAAVAAALAAGFNLPQFKRKAAPAKIRRIRILGLDRAVDLSRTIAESRGNNLARHLTALPPNILNAVTYAAMLKQLAKEQGWEYKRFNTRDLEKMGAGAFLAVAQGNEDDSASIVRLRYRPGKPSSAPTLSLVGKGIIFDTGGTNLKPFTSMLDMHHDMQGSAVAVGTLLTISELKLPLAVDTWLAITENRTGPSAYKSQDVVTAANGKTIQTIHTDAEGRMVLADTLTFASRDKPKLIVDFATLTGCYDPLQWRFYKPLRLASASQTHRAPLRRACLAISHREGIPRRPEKPNCRHSAMFRESAGRPYSGRQFSGRVHRERYALGAYRSCSKQPQRWSCPCANRDHRIWCPIYSEFAPRRQHPEGRKVIE